jgi:hypothetical protein
MGNELFRTAGGISCCVECSIRQILRIELVPPNQALPPNKTAGKQADGMCVLQFTLHIKFYMINNLFISMNSVRWVQIDS